MGEGTQVGDGVRVVMGDREGICPVLSAIVKTAVFTLREVGTTENLSRGSMSALYSTRSLWRLY